MQSVTINRRAADRLASGHPWIFTSDVLDRGKAEGGDAVCVINQRGNTLGTAHFSSSSQITLRLLSRKVETVDHDFYFQRLSAALEYRRRIVNHSDSYRLVHGEADQLPGLVVDIYAGCIVMQTLTQGMDRVKPLLVDCLRELLHPRAIVARNDVAVRTKELLPLEKGLLFGTLPEQVIIQVNGLQLTADLLGGQKTGIYLDQRQNYAAAARYASGRALDCFTSTGGFTLHLAAACEQVEGIDSSGQALATAQANASRNGIANVTWREADVFDLLAQYSQARRSFNVVVLDPPAFTKSRGAVEAAARGYKEINQRALRLLGPGGILITCSCSHHFSEAQLLETVAAAALDAGKTLRVLERRTQAQDHPILLTVPETLYLKCLILEVF